MKIAIMLTCLAMTSEPFRITITLKSFVARPMLTAGFFKTDWTIQTCPTDVTSTIIRCLTFAIVTAISTNRLRTWMQWIFIFLRFFPTRLADDITTAIAEITTSSLKSKMNKLFSRIIEIILTYFSFFFLSILQILLDLFLFLISQAQIFSIIIVINIGNLISVKKINV